MSYYLKKNHGGSLPQHLIAIDTETVDTGRGAKGVERHTLKLGCLIYRRFDNRRNTHNRYYTYEYRFESIQELIDILCKVASKTKTRYYIYTHNANFDYAIINLPHIIETMGLEVKYYINEKPPVIVETKLDSTTLLWLDSLNIFRISLSALADTLGLVAKGDMSAATNDEELYDYCRNDTRILIESLTLWRNFIKEHRFGNYAKTIAGQAFNAFRHRFLQDRTLLQTSQPEVLQLERKTYFGGRTECFRLGRYEGQFFSVDVNSMYPHVMAAHDYPVRFLGIETDFNPYEYNYPTNVKPGMATCLLKLTEPILPVIMHGRLCFPIGVIQGTFTWPELAYVKPFIEDIRFDTVYMYEYLPVFREWVETLYPMRLGFKKSGNKAYAQLTKLIMNSLYGKFGQLTPTWEDLGKTNLPEGADILAEDIETGLIHRQRVRLGILQQISDRVETDHSMPLLASHVTAHGRIMLHQLMTTAGLEDIYYCDTDSLIVNETGLVNLSDRLHPDRLGALDIQWQSEWVDIQGLKRYRAEGVTRSKGIKPTAKPLGADRYEQPMFRSWDYHLSRGEHGIVDIHTITKRLTGEYLKGVVQPSGRVVPLSSTYPLD